MMRMILLVGLCGAIGAIGRYSVSGWIYRLTGASFPFGTLAVNLLGCLLLGLITHIGINSDLIRPAMRQAVAVGALGAFTTFSTFGYETLIQFQAGQYRAGLTNIACNVLAGLFCVWSGMQLGRLVVGAA